MPTDEITLTGWKRRITDYCADHGIDKTPRQVKNLASKIHLRAERLQSFDPDDLLRSVLDYQDPTGETAVANVMDPRPVAPTYRVIDVTDWAPEQINDLHYEDEITDDRYAADLAAWEEREAARNGAAA